MKSLRLRWWELILLFLLVLVAVLFFAGDQWVGGIVLLAVVGLLVTSRAEIVERNVAGGYARTRGRVELAKLLSLGTIYLVAIGCFVVMSRDEWTSDTRGTVAMCSLAGLTFFLMRELNRVSDSALNWLVGSDFERLVADDLDTLPSDGWIVTHDLRMDRGGNIDHFVVGPKGAYAIESKHGRGSAADRSKAVAQAVWAKQKFGQRWVTAVVCVGTDPPDEPQRHGYAWVVGRRDVAAFVRSGRR